jgi:two-component system phosphate regulon sensor histidine kinase PhoR
MFRSIRWRIAVPYIILILATMIGLAVYLTFSSRRSYLDSTREQLLDEAALVADLIRPALAAGGQADLAALARRYADLLNVRITIIDAQGAVLAETDADAGVTDNLLSRPEVQQALSGAGGSSVRQSATLRLEMLYAAVPVTAGSQVAAIARLSVPISAIDAKVLALDRTLVGETLLALLLSLVLAVLIAERTTKPLRELTAAAEQMSHGELDVRIQPTTRDEVARLSDAFNEMASAFQQQMSDVTEQRNNLSAVLTHMTDGAVITDEEGRVSLINPAAVRLLGLRSVQSTGESLVAVVRDHQVVDVWQRCRQTGREQSDLVELGGRGPFVRVIATPLQEKAASGALLILQDLTQVRRLETVRRDFISNISHELRNPLAALKALVDTLRDGALDDRPMAERFLVQMDAEVDAMTQMVRELLELSRIESGRVPLRLEAVAVADLVAPAVERLRPQAERAGLTLALDLPDGLPPVKADSERLQQVLVNLIHNAIKFTPPGGRITVSAEPGDVATILVRDTGVGIPAADLTRIFERFYKADRARSGGGTGLGLAIAKHLVQAHGGQIWAESVEGQGATFRFTLPLA